MQTKVSHPGKIGKVGAKKKEAIDKVIAVTIYRTTKDVNTLGGIEAAKELIGEEFDFKLKMKLSN